jgi:ABC-type branched-subunit amino acid transport system substrate-binding protein
MSKKYRIGYLDEDEGYQAKFYQAFKNEFDIKILPIENINMTFYVSLMMKN